MSTQKKGILEPLRTRVRRFQFIVGLGFAALMLGSFTSGALAIRLNQRFAELPTGALRLLVGILMEDLWVLAALPLLAYGAARIMELRPLSTALGAALAGEVFVLALQFVREGSLLSEAGWRVDVLRGVAFVVGVILSHRAVTQGRAAAEKVAEAARSQAEAKKSEYDDFLRQAELEGERAAQREAARAAAASENAQSPAAPAQAPAEGGQVVHMTPATAEPSAPVAPAQASDGETPKASGS